MARSSSMPLVAALLIGLIVLGMIGVVVHRENSNPLLKWMLVSEEHGGVQLASGTVRAGYVYSFGWTDSGWAFQAKTNTRLVDKVELDNINLNPGDIIAPHLDDWWLDGRSGYVLFGGVTSIADTASTDELSYGAMFNVEKVPEEAYAPVMAWPSTAGYPDIHIGTSLQPTVWLHIYYNSSRVNIYSVSQSSWGIPGSWNNVLVLFSGKNGILKIYRNNGLVFDNSGPWHADINFTTTTGNMYIGKGPEGYNDYLGGYISYIYIAKDTIEPDSYYNHTLDQNTIFLADPTWYNGTSYTDLVSGVTGTPYGGVQRVPAEQLWLWQVKQLSSDSKLHFRYFPPGTIIKAVDSSGNVVREWTIPSTDANAAGLVEDYAVDIGTGLNNVNLTASIPSGKARIYGPPGFTVKVNGDTYSSEYTIPSVGYVDVPIPDGSDTVSMLASGEREGALGVSATSTGDALKVQVYNTSSGVALSGAVVVAKKNNEAASAVTDENGFATVNIKPDAPITLEVYYLGDGIVYTGSSMYTPPTSNSAALPEENHSHTALLLIILLLLGAAIALLALRGRR